MTRTQYTTSDDRMGRARDYLAEASDPKTIQSQPQRNLADTLALLAIAELLTELLERLPLLVPADSGDQQPRP